MERIYRFFFLVLFVMGFVGAVAGADRTGNDSNPSPIASLIRDVRLAQEVNSLNHDRWNQDVAKANEEGLSQVENLFRNQGLAKSVKQ